MNYLSKQLREADRKLTALENDVKAVRLIQRMNRDEQEKLAMKLLLLKAQMILSRHGEFQAADEIGDFLSTPFASTEGEQVSCGHGAQRDSAAGVKRAWSPVNRPIETPAGIHFASTPDEAQGHTSRVVAGETDGCGELPLGANAAGLMPSGVSTKTPLLRNEQPSEIFPRTPPSDAGSGAVHRGARPRIVLCNPERKSIVRSAEERGK